MIILDMNQISLASLMMHQHMTKSSEVEEDAVRHMILNSVRMYRSKFIDEYGEVVLAYDSRHYWRKDYFPEYKASRKKGRETDNKDWDKIFQVLNNIKSELKTIFPYKFLEVYGAEADDIIATLFKKYQNEKVMIVSCDKDFIQLQKYDNVKQYSPTQKKFINDINPYTYIQEHVLRGDKGDGVPNVLSPDQTFVNEIRQKPLSKKKLESLLNLDVDSYPNEIKRNYQRNVMLINLDNIPAELEEQILDEYTSAPCGDRSKLFNYFIENKLKTLTESIGEF